MKKDGLRCECGSYDITPIEKGFLCTKCGRRTSLDQDYGTECIQEIIEDSNSSPEKPGEKSPT